MHRLDGAIQVDRAFRSGYVAPFHKLTQNSLFTAFTSFHFNL